MSKRGTLHFDNLDQAAEYARQLLDRGYTVTGKWNLSQTCGHLSQWLSFPMDGFPRPGLPVRIILWCMKATSGRRMLKKVLADGFKSGLPTMPETVPAADAKTDSEAVDWLARTVERFEAHNGAFYPSPLYGDMDRQRLTQLQLRHCEHHLGFLKLKEL